MNKALLFATALLFASCCFAQPLFAQTPTTTGKRGYKIEYSNILPNASIGQVPIRVRITRVPAVPLVNDQSFNVSINNGWNYETDRSTTSAELVLPAGKTSAEVELLLMREVNYCSLLIEPGNRHTNSYADDLFRAQVDTYNSGASDNHGTWLLISSKAPNNLAFRATCHPRQPLGNNVVPTSIGSASFQSNFRDDKEIPGLKTIFQESINNMLDRDDWHALHPTELPQTWVGLSAINYVLISNDEFKSLTQVPAYQKMIEQWVAAGGYLIVFNSDNSLAHADSVFPGLLGPERATPPRLWAAVSSTPNGSPIHRSQAPSYRPASELIPKNRAAFSPHLNGMVVVMVSPEKLPRWFKERHFQYPISITENALHVGNAGNRRQESSIPGVGKPPIALFGVFTALFLFLIGPVILVIVTLNNNRRFLFFLVPMFSFLTCTGILGYAIVADFNKQLARTNTITALDSRSGLAYSKASSAYYCGSQPSYYAYDTDTLIATTVDYENGYRIRQLPEENRLSSPRIQPRKNHEVFTAKPYRTQQRFLVAESAEKPKTPEVTNLLGGRIERAFFEYQGKTYLVKDLEPKQTTLGIELPPESCRKELRQAADDRQHQGRSPLFYSASAQISAVISHAREARHFVAILDVNPAIEPLIEPFDYKLQLHVVHGKY